MQSIELKGNKYSIEWNFYAQMVMERVNAEHPELLKTNISALGVSLYAALMGGNEAFDHDIDWIVRSLGTDLQNVRDIMQKLKAETEAFRSLNALLNGEDTEQEGNAEAPTDGAK